MLCLNLTVRAEIASASSSLMFPKVRTVVLALEAKWNRD